MPHKLGMVQYTLGSGRPSLNCVCIFLEWQNSDRTASCLPAPHVPIAQLSGESSLKEKGLSKKMAHP